MMQKAWCRLEDVPCCFSRSSVKFKGHTAKIIINFVPNWAFPDCNSCLNSPMAMKWCTKLEAAWGRCPIFFKVIRQFSRSRGTKKIANFDRVEGFRTVTPVWIYQWLWNAAQSLMWYRIGALLFFNVIHQISRSKLDIICSFKSNLGKTF